ncbi:hypothetical protein LSTR_LSTR006596 [Laodelphax striatellus]|uniref:Transmembrane and coiled-coil domain-containing protein 4 n=1 Tax=Laodelphax striatellus TaxID=195883 RepID=A0A482WZU1_LAOST|nr:hypothetical protein LSTR_LSTR006596 [Laodelphax striatellus]
MTFYLKSPDKGISEEEASAKDRKHMAVGTEQVVLLSRSVDQVLSEAGRYSYSAICAILLNSLYDNEWDRPFSETCLRTIISHLDLPSQVDPIMFSILKGETKQSTADTESYLELIMNDSVVSTDDKVDEIDKLFFLMQQTILLAVRQGVYDARWRVLMRAIGEIFSIGWPTVEEFEATIVNCLSMIQPVKSAEEVKGDKMRQRLVKVKRYALIGLATVGGGALIGVTGGLAAPLIGAGLGSMVGGSALLAALGSTAGTAIVASLFGAAGAGLTGYKMHKRVGEIEEFAFGYLSPVCADNAKICDELSEAGTSADSGSKSSSDIQVVPIQQQLHITIAVTGWLKDDQEDNFTRPWLCLCSSREQYYLKYESSYLLELGRAIEYFASIAVSIAAQQALKYTVLSGLISAVAWPASLIGLASVIDNPWGVCCRRSAQVGKQLAQVLLAREHGQRPVTLIGFSLGARVIYYCLRVRMTDWLLKFLYRTLSMPSGGVAGLQPIELKNKKMQNVDLTALVSGHSEYPDKIYEILKAVGVTVREVKRGVNSKLKHSKTDFINIPKHPVTPRSSSESDLQKLQTKSNGTSAEMSSSNPPSMFASSLSTENVLEDNKS